jgi:hypothetical protein
VKQGFILAFIVGYLLEDLEDVLELLASWGYEQHASATVVELERTIEIHGLILWLVDWN